MRRLLAISLLVPMLPAAARAAPRLSLSVRPAPVQGFAGTGNRAGAGATVLVAIGIEGGEQAGHPPPLARLSLGLPPGVVFDGPSPLTLTALSTQARASP